MLNPKGIESFTCTRACQTTGHCDKRSCQPDLSEQQLVDLIYQEVLTSLGQTPPESKAATSQYPKIPLGVSNRHIHLTKETFATLFGPQTGFEKMRDLYQPGEFASTHVLTIAGPKMRTIEGVRVLGPFRAYDQVELTLTDSVYMGINPPIRNSGDLKGAAPLTLVGPAGSVFRPECGIIANRHLHMSNKEAQMFGLKSGDFCRVRVPGDKSVVLEHVLVRTHDTWKLQMHLDTDDANAAAVRCQTLVEFAGKM